MIEYLYDAVVATAGEDVSITAELTDCAGKPYETGCYMTVYDDEGPILMVEGLYIPDIQTWSFKLPAKQTANLYGRFWYEISSPENSMCFKQPLYLK